MGVFYEKLTQTSIFVCFFSSRSTFTSTGYSQDEGGSNLQIEEIIVTAQKREQSAQDVPISITAMDEELKLNN